MGLMSLLNTLQYDKTLHPLVADVYHNAITIPFSYKSVKPMLSLNIVYLSPVSRYYDVTVLAS